MKKEVLDVGKPVSNAPYSPVVRAGDLLFLSGQVAQNEEGKLLEGGFDAQARQCLKQVQDLLEAVGASLDHVVKTTVYIADLENFQRLNAIYREVFPNNRPARTCIQVSRIPLDADVEVEAIAVVPD